MRWEVEESKHEVSEYSKTRKRTCGLKKSNSRKPANSILNAILKHMLGHGVLSGKALFNAPSPKKVQKMVTEHGTTRECRLPSGIALLLRTIGDG